jgi:hypothetical protein
MNLFNDTPNIRLSDYRHDRSRPVDKTIPELHAFIDTFADQEILDNWYAWFDIHFGLPRSVVKQFFKKYLADSFDYSHICGFNQRTLPTAIPKFSVLYIGFSVYIMLFRKNKNNKTIDVDLIIDNIEWNDALERFNKLIELFGKKNVAAVVPGDQKIYFNNVKVFNRPRYKRLNINRYEFWKVIKGFWFHLKYSKKVQVNLLSATIHILHSYFYYHSLFKILKGKYCIIYQHYETDAIKNYLFKKSGGICSAVIQKNIHQQGHTGFYYDADVFFSLGKGTADRAFKLGARIERVVPVGSFFMEHHWFNQKQSAHLDTRWDIINFGGNAHTPGSFCDIYDSHNGDYREHLLWMVRLSNDYPNLRIGFKHHSNYRFEKIEESIFADSNVKLIDQKLNSYQLAFQSRIVVSWASTMVSEMIGHGIPSFYLNPNGSNDQFIDNHDAIISISKYEDLKKVIDSTLFNTTLKEVAMPSNIVRKYCLNSEDVSVKIKNNFDAMV